MSERTLPVPGTHLGRKNGAIVVYETDKGSLCAAIPISIEGDVKWHGKHTATLVKSNGELMTRRIDDLKTIFGWAGVDFFELEGIDEANEMPFELVVEHKEWIPEGADEGTEPTMILDVVFMNPVGGSAKMPTALEGNERKALLAKFGSKFKAHSASKPAAKTSTPAKAAGSPAKAASAPAKPAQSGPPSRRSNATSATARTSSVEEVWDAYVEANPGKSQDDLGTKFYAAQDEVRPGANGDMTPAEWGQVADKLGV